MVEKMRDLERKLELREKKEKRINIVMKEITVKKGKRRETVEEIFDCISAKVRIEEVRKLKRNVERRTEMIWIRLENEGQRREVMKKKKNLRGRTERIVKNSTWKERKMRWKLEETAREEERREYRVWIGYVKRLELTNNSENEMKGRRYLGMVEGK